MKKEEFVQISRFRKNTILLLKFLRIYTPARRLVSKWQENSRERKYLNKMMIEHYKQFVKRDDLIFDLGANNGNRTNIFLILGAKKIVAVEPTTYSYNLLKKRFGKNKKVTLLKKEIYDRRGIAEINVCSDTAYSTFDKEELNDLKKNNELKNLEWNQKEKVQLISLNDIIQKEGIPDFVKIDIEGSEEKALSTLKYSIPSFSFEYHANFKKKTLKCINYICNLGRYEFNYSERETFKFILKNWCDGERIKKEILKKENNDWGDIYCRLIKK